MGQQEGRHRQTILANSWTNFSAAAADPPAGFPEFICPADRRQVAGSQIFCLHSSGYIEALLVKVVVGRIELMRWWNILGLAFVVALSGAMAPGPMLTMVISQVLAQGVTAVLFILLGHALLELLVVALMAKGLAKWLEQPRLRAALGILGGMVLAWMGLGLIGSLPTASLSGSADSAQSWWMLVLSGAGVSLANPYFTGWWISVGSGQMAALELRSPRRLVPFYIGHELGDLAWYLLVALVLVLGKNWLNDNVYRGLLGTCIAVMVGLGLLFIVIGMRGWWRAGKKMADPAAD
jgi:threonine/homoserine/homoserine lactone efflux protein